MRAEAQTDVSVYELETGCCDKQPPKSQGLFVLNSDFIGLVLIYLIIQCKLGTGLCSIQ